MNNQFRKIVIQEWCSRYFRWSTLYELGNSRLLRFSYVWLVVVPMAAKFLVNVEKILTFTVYGQTVEINARLPFSWKVFYFSSAFFAVAGLIYSFRCMGLAKYFRTFTEYESEGRGILPLLLAARVHGDKISENSVRRFITLAQSGEPVDRELTAEAFWAIRGHQDTLRPKSLAVCAIFYFAGFSLLAWVIAQNFLFVVRVTL